MTGARMRTGTGPEQGRASEPGTGPSSTETETETEAAGTGAETRSAPARGGVRAARTRTGRG